MNSKEDLTQRCANITASMVRSRDAERQAIEQHIQEFLDAGNTILKVDEGDTNAPMANQTNKSEPLPWISHRYPMTTH